MKYYTISIIVILSFPILLFSQNKYLAHVVQPNPISKPSICIVTVVDNLNVIVFDKPTNHLVNYTKIYRESSIQTGTWDSIGVVLNSNPSFFVDSASKPYKQSNRYKISSIDNCGKETIQSNTHKTINLSIIKGINNTYSLIWDEYEGFPVSSYRIYRGTTKDELQLIGSTTDNLSYNDSYSPTGAIYYQIEVLSVNECNTGNFKSASIYNSSRSNIASNVQTSLNTSEIDPGIKINPNPFNNVTLISILYDISNNYTLSVYDLTGKKVRTEHINNNQFVFYRKNLPSGLYYIEIKGKKQVFRKKMTISK